jgi:uncharacterized integral membrane protein
MILLLAVALIVSILAGVFALQNAIPISVSFLLWKIDGSLALVLLITFALGCLVSFLVLIPSTVRRRRAFSQQNKQIAGLERQLQDRSASQPLPPTDKSRLE